MQSDHSDGQDAHEVRIDVAQSIVAEQAHCTLDEALDLMLSKADEMDATLHFIAGEVINGRVRFD